MDKEVDVKLMEKISLQAVYFRERGATFENGDSDIPSHDHDEPPSKWKNQSKPVAPTFSRATKPDKRYPTKTEIKMELEHSQEYERMDVTEEDPPVDSIDNEDKRNPDTSYIPDQVLPGFTSTRNTNPPVSSNIEDPLTSGNCLRHWSQMENLDSNGQTYVNKSPQTEGDLASHHQPPEGSTQHETCTRIVSEVQEDRNRFTEPYYGSPPGTSWDKPRKWGKSQITLTTYHTPKYTIISKDLAHLLATSGETSKAIFFHRLASPETLDEVPAQVPNKFYPDKWKLIEANLNRLRESCPSGWLSEHPFYIGERVSKAEETYCSDALRSDFRILSGTQIAPHVVATLPRIVTQALLLPSLLSSCPIPILESGKSGTLFVTKSLCCSLLASAFFSTFPQYRGDLPDINFHRLFNKSYPRGRAKVKTEKVMCLLNYFHQMSKSSNQEKLGHHIISYERRCLRESEFPIWAESNKPLIKVVVEPLKKIEEADGMLQVDFANKIVGGGVLNDGAIMEEILFAICPELILARVFTEPLADNEALVISGAHQFSRYKGYSSTFEFDQPHVITDLGQDNLGRLNTHVVAMDALHFQGNPTQQFQKKHIDRELRKSYVGFLQKAEPIPVATGNWGCGAFHGDIELKFLIQWISASVSGCPSLHYHTVGDDHQAKLISETVALIQDEEITTGKLYELIIKFRKNLSDYTSIFQFISDVLLKRFRSSEEFERTLDYTNSFVPSHY